MNWLEIVNIRTAGKTEFINALECCGHTQQDLEAGGIVCVRVYHNTIYTTDLSIHLFWDSATSSPAKTSVGIQLSKSLTRFGLIDHKILQPVQMNEDGVAS
jgi:hypothetical protein